MTDAHWREVVEQAFWDKANGNGVAGVRKMWHYLQQGTKPHEVRLAHSTVRSRRATTPRPGGQHLEDLHERSLAKPFGLQHMADDDGHRAAGP